MNFGRNILTIFTIFVACMSVISCSNYVKKNDTFVKYKGKAAIEFQDTIYDFGIMTEGEIAEYSFTFKNTGTAPLKIKNVVTDCGCTVPEYDKKSVLPGKNAKIKITFDSRGFRNNIYKTITVETNADKSKNILILTAYIKNNNSLNY